MSDCMTQEDAMHMDNNQAIQILESIHDRMLDQYGCPISTAYFALDKAIKALKQPERKKGKWIKKKNIVLGDHIECSLCGNKESRIAPGWWNSKSYCPNCGADMRGGNDE